MRMMKVDTLSILVTSILWVEIFTFNVPLSVKAKSEANDQSVVIIGLFSVCLDTPNNGSKTIGSMSKEFQSRAVGAYLHFKRTSAYYKEQYNTTLSIDAVAIDVCDNTTLLVSTILDLALDQAFNKIDIETFPNNEVVVEHPIYITIYSFLIESLMKVALQLLSSTRVPYFAIKSELYDYVKNRNELAYYSGVPISKFEHVSKIVVTQSKLIYDRVFDFGWNNLVLVLLGTDDLYVSRIDFFFKLLKSKKYYCLARMNALSAEKVEQVARLLKQDSSRKVIYAMGNRDQTQRFLLALDRQRVYGRFLFLDYKSASVDIPERLKSGLFFIPFRGFYGEYRTNELPEHILVPNSFRYNFCVDNWFVKNKTNHNTYYNRNSINVTDTKNDVHELCHVNRSLSLTQFLLNENNNKSSIAELLGHALVFPYWMMSKYTAHHHHYHRPSSPELSRLINYKFRALLHGNGYSYKTYLLNMNASGFPNVCFIGNFPESCGWGVPVTWPGNITKRPNYIDCSSNGVGPVENFPGYEFKWGTIPANMTSWDFETGRGLSKCPYNKTKKLGELSCQSCAEGLISDKNRTECVDPYTKISVFSFGNTYSVIFSTLIFFGYLVSLVFAGLFIRYRNTPVVKSSQFKFTLLQFLSHFFDFFCLMYAFAYHQDNTACILLTVGVAFLLSFNMALAIVKTRIVIDIFNSKFKIDVDEQRKRNQRNAFVIVFIVSCSIFLSVITIVVNRPDAVANVVAPRMKFSYCNFGYHLQIQFGYAFLLSVVCSAQSILRARHLPDTFKSTRYIIYAMFTNLMIMLVFYIVYNVQRGNRFLQIYVLGYAAVSSNYALLLIVHSNRIVGIFDRTRNTKTVVRQQIQINIQKQTNKNDRLRVKVIR